MIAAALAGDPQLVVADEPTTALDVTTQAAILDLFDRIVDSRSMAILLVTHELDTGNRLRGFCDEVAVMYAGQIVNRGNVETIFEEALHPYTNALIEALPDPETEAVRLRTIDGSPPDLANLPPGCAFEPRCPLGHGKPVCRTARPELQMIGNERVACHLAHPNSGAGP